MRWSKEKAWQWYNSRPWMRGSNYVSADSCNRIDFWQELGFEERFKTTEKELQLMQETGFNTVRLILEYVVWKEEHDSFLVRFERYLELFHKYGISCMIVLANDCMPPKTEYWSLPYVGEQEFHMGYQFNRIHSQHGVHNNPAPHFYLDDPETKEDYFRMVREIVTKYKDDPRICIWDVYNEVGNSKRGNISLPILKEMFELLREINPSQPLTCAIWALNNGDEPYSDLDRYCLENSDIISYHSYATFSVNVKIIARLKKEGRPIINTEWLGRCNYNTVESMFPLFYLENIGNWCWGFVAGKSQAYEPWEFLYNFYDDGDRAHDLKAWLHDLYRGNHRPYDPEEIRLIKEYCALADKDWADKQNG